MGGVAYQIGPSLSADEFVDVLRRSTLAERRPVTDAAAIAAAARVPLILDPAPAPDGGLPPALLRHVTCLKPNASEAERLTGIPVTDAATAAEAAAALRRLGPPIVIVTLGGDGAILVDAGGARHVAAPRVAAVDTTAAGDAFTGALATAVGQGLGWDEAVRRAAGALAATRLGAQPSLPTRAEGEEFLAARHDAQTGRTKT